MLRRVWKPWFVRRPAQLLRRVRAAVVPPSAGYRPIPTSWGVPIIAEPTRVIGRSILTTGVFDLAVSELLARLTDDGDTVVDAGANVGYMTVLAAVAAGPRGQVLAFEPHPELFRILTQNVESAGRRCAIAPVDLHNQALGARIGQAQLHVPAEFAGNDGVSRIVADRQGPGTIAVSMKTLDEVLGSRSVAVLKMDVEGHEAAVIAGGRAALTAGRIGHILFEDHDIHTSEAANLLRSHGYTLHALGWNWRGLTLQSIDGARTPSSYEAPSFVATRDPAGLTRRVSPSGWLVLSERVARRRGRFVT